MEIKITYETLFDLVRREKHRSELQKLEPNFYNDVVAYLSDKAELLKQQEQKTDILSSAQREKTRHQITNIKKILTGFFEKRQEKIIIMALNKSKTEALSMDISMLLAEEKAFYDNILKVLSGYRQNTLSNLLELKKPVIGEQPELAVGVQGESPSTEGSDSPAEEQDVPVRVIFLGTVDQFIGPDLSPVGPFKTDEEAELPKIIADALINKGIAEKV